RLLHARAHVLVALGLLQAVEGRGVDRDEDLRAGRARLRRRLGKPQVLADREADLAALVLEHARPVAGREVALLVEDIVVGQPRPGRAAGALSAARRVFGAFPSKSPTVVLIWATAIFIARGRGTSRKKG